MAQEKAEVVMLRDKVIVSIAFTSRRGRRHSLVVLGPPAQETPPDIVVEHVGDRDGGPNVGHVERCPNQSSNQENGNVEVGESLELPAKEVEWDR